MLHAQLFPDYIYKSNIRFPLVYKVGSDQSNNVIDFNSTQQLYFGFDDLDFDVKNYSYQVIHCNPDWTKSDLLHMQYMNGFESYPILDWRFSQNCTQPYTHYYFTFPNEQMSTSISGNFIMKVFETDNPEEIVYTRRFMVVENILKINAKVRFASDVNLRNTHQEIYMTLNKENIMIQNAFTDLVVNITQNNRWDNAKINVGPQFIGTNTITYNHIDGKMSFEAGNQYRFIDLKTLMLVMEPIMDRKIENGTYHLRVRDIISRSVQTYQALPDINGRFTFYNQDAFTNTIDADYAWVYFSIPATSWLLNKEVFLIGGFSFGQLLDQYKLRFDVDQQKYFIKIPLKQGYYNYLFVVKDKNGESIQPLEGSFAETENDYQIYVYVKQPSDITHKLVGVEYINSLEDR